MAAPPVWLLIIAERAALAWVLDQQRTAFPASRERDVAALESGHRLLLYTTRGCFHNPTRDRGRVIGVATVLTKPTVLTEVVNIAGRSYPIGCDLEIPAIAPIYDGVELAPLVPALGAFPDPSTWSAWLRRPLLALSDDDASRIRAPLEPRLQPRNEVLAGYLEAARRTVARVAPA
jgi:hypothetical protein